MNDVIVLMLLGVITTFVALVYFARKQKDRRAGPPDTTPVRYTTHVRQRMNERGVTSEQVESVLANPARRVPVPQEASVRLEGDFADRVLKVWVVAPWPNRHEIVIKSAAWTDFLITFTIPAGTVSQVKGGGGKTIKEIEKTTGARVAVDRHGAVRVSAKSRASIEAAKQKVMAFTR